MRDNYTEAEVAALVELQRVVSDEVVRGSQQMTAYVDHLRGCGSEEHRATIAQKTKLAASSMLSCLRYAAWIEAELAGVRLFENPQAQLAEWVAKQEDIARQIAAKRGETLVTEPVPAAQPEAPLPAVAVQDIPLFTFHEQEAAINARINAPYPLTKQ